MTVILTQLGQDVIAGFNYRYVHARCDKCGVYGAPVNDGYQYRCAASRMSILCTGNMVAIHA